MASPKKKPSKPKKKPAKSSAPKRAGARSAPAGLTIDDKQRLLKPGGDYDTVLRDALAAWKANGRYIKVPDLSAAKLGSQAKKAGRAWDKERAFRAKMDAKLKPLMDARMRAEDLVMRGMLDLYAEVKSSSRRRPELEDAFETLAEFAARGGGRGGGTPAAPTS